MEDTLNYDVDLRRDSSTSFSRANGCRPQSTRSEWIALLKNGGCSADNPVTSRRRRTVRRYLPVLLNAKFIIYNTNFSTVNAKS